MDNYLDNKTHAQLLHIATGLFKEHHEVDQTLGKVLGYPETFPMANAVDDGDVSTGDHVLPTLAQEAAERIRKLEQKIFDLGQHINPMYCSWGEIPSDPTCRCLSCSMKHILNR